MARRFAGLPTASILGLEIPIATTRRARLLGLAHLDREAAGPGILLPHCRSIHTFGMRFPIDVLYLDADVRVLERHDAVGSRRILVCRSAAAVVELPSVGGDSIRPGA
jgi:uncharacterized membrane protein (UPF0127 family)